MANTKKSFSELIGAGFNSIGALKDEAAAVEEQPAEQGNEKIEESTAKTAELKKESLDLAEKSFEDIVTPYKDGFYVIRKKSDDEIIAVGLEKKLNEGEDYILKNIKSTNACKNGEIEYTLLPFDCINIFKKDWLKGNLKIYNIKNGLDAVVNLDAKTEDTFAAKIKKEGFVEDIEVFGECRKTSVVLPVKFIRYCTRRGEDMGVFKGAARFFLTNVVAKDIREHRDEIDIDKI